MALAPVAAAVSTGSAAHAPFDREGFRPYVQALGRGETLRRDLTQAEARDAMDRILSGRVSPAQQGAFLMTQRVKGESQAEIQGFVEAVRRRWLTPLAPRSAEILDLAVPYDGKARTAQLAPAVAVVLAACGLPVLLHGDAGVPTKNGVTPAQVLDQMGIATHLAPRAAAHMLDAVGLAYCGAQAFMPAWHALLPLRWEFGLRTVLNTVEKLINPATAAFQASGFYHTKYIHAMRAAQTGRKASWIIQGEEGSVELRAGRKTRLFGPQPEAMHILDPGALGLAANETVAAGADPRQHAALNVQALHNADAPARRQVALSAGVLLGLFGAAASWEAGVAAAEACLASGQARAALRDARKYADH